MEIKVNKDYTLSNKNLSPIFLDIIKCGINDKELEMLKKKIIEDHQKEIIEYHFEKRNFFIFLASNAYDIISYYNEGAEEDSKKFKKEISDKDKLKAEFLAEFPL